MIGVFDSGYGGLSVLREIAKRLPQYSYLYLGDNARAPYGTRSFDCVYEFTLQAVRYLFDQGCPLVILACNTASAKALRTIQQRDLPDMDDPTRRVLGVIRPTAEKVGEISKNGQIGIFGTPGTIASESHDIEIAKLWPDFHVYGQPCPMWVPIVENMEMNTPGADYFVEKYVNQLFGKQPEIDTVVLGCTHYPLLYDSIRRFVPPTAQVISQGEIVAESLADYLRRHPEMEHRLQRSEQCEQGAGPCSPQITCEQGPVPCSPDITYLTTEHPSKFQDMASVFMGQPVENVTKIQLS